MTGWREDMRADRLVRARIDREQAETAARLRLADRQAAATERRADTAARATARDAAAAARRAGRAAAAGWVRGHVLGLLFVPVIVVPAVLAWTAMAAYGRQVYGGPGWLLPAFSEGSMWAFAAANTLTRRTHPGRPAWHLQAGTWVFATAAAGLNFAHGLTPGGTAPRGVAVAAVMAVVSVAGVTAHQIVTAGPRRSRADRDAAGLARSAQRRALAVRRAAVRRAAAELDGDGAARLVFRAGLVTVTGHGRRSRLVPAVVPGLPVTPMSEDPDWDRDLAALTAAGPVTGVTAPGQDGGEDGDGPGPAAVPAPPGNSPGPGSGVAALAEAARAAITAGALPPGPSQRALRDLLGIRMARAAQVQRALTRDRRTP